MTEPYRRRLSLAAKRKRDAEIVRLRDTHHLTFGVLGIRFGVSEETARKLYRDKKGLT